MRLFLLLMFSIMSIGVLTSQCVTAFPENESFEFGLGSWTQSISDDFDWARLDVPTPTTGTGPVSAMNGAHYLYAEATGNSNNTATIETCLDLTTYCHAEIEFNYHMYGSNVGQLILEGSTDAGLTWTSIWSESGDQGSSWYVRKESLTSFTGGQLLLRFNASNLGDLGDIALDNVRVRALTVPEISNITHVEPRCEDDNGSITVSIVDVINVDSINFSIDGAATWMSPVADNSGTVDFTNLGPGFYDLWVRNNNSSCEVNLSDVTLVNQASPVVTFSMSTVTYCAHESSFSLSGGMPSGGEYTGTGVDAGSFIPSLAGPGVHTITYTYTDSNGCEDSESLDLTVYAAPTVSLVLTTTIDCIDNNSLSLTEGLPAGGEYSGPGVTGTNFDASDAGVGIHTITYTYKDVYGCENTATDDIQVFDLPNVALNLPTATICDNVTTLALSGGTPTGGSYTGLAVTGTNFDANAAGVGVHTITYTYTDGNGCTNVATDNIEVFAQPTVTFSLSDNTSCVTESGYDLSGSVSPSGGNFSGAGVTGSIFDANVAGVGTHTLTYSYTGNNGCSDDATVDMIVHALPTVSLALGTTSACDNQTVLALTGGSPSGISFSGAGVTGSNFDASAAGVGVHTITYSYTDGNGCTNTATDDIQVYAQPTVSLNLVNDWDCEDNSALVLDGGIPAGGSYSGVAVDGDNFDANSAGVGVHTITYTYIDDYGCENYATDEITVHSLTTVSLSLSSDLLCEDQPGVNLDGGMPAEGSYSGTGVSGTWFDAAIAGVGVHTITYTYTDPVGCVNSATDVITVNALPTVTLTLNKGEACLDETITLSGVSPSGGTFSGSGVTGDDFNASEAGVGTHTITYTYTDVNGCTNVASDFIEVYDLPSVQLNLANDSACETSTGLALSGGFPAEGVYSGTAVTGSTFNPSVAGVGTHTITYTYTDDNGCINSATDDISVYALPAVTLNLTQTEICSDEPGFTLSGGAPAGGTYSGTGVGGNYFNVVTAGVGVHTITYTYTDPTSGCESSATQDVEVFALPNVELFLTDDEECSYSTTLALGGGTPFGGTYTGPGVTAGNFDAFEAGIGTHIITYTYIDANGCMDTATDQMVVHSDTWVGLTLTDDTECNNSTLRELTEGLPADGTYSGPGVSGTNFDANVAGIGVHTITYTFTDAYGCSFSASDDITVSAPPVVSLDLLTDEGCEDESGFTLDGGSPAGGTWSGTGVSGNYFDITVAGPGVHSVTYSYTDPSSGCENSASQNVSVYSLPNVALDFSVDQACISSTTFTLTEGLPAVGTYSGTGVTGTNFDASAAGLGTHTITYTYTDGNGCTNVATDDITVNALPNVTLSLPNAAFCINSSDVTLSGGSPTGGTYTGLGVSSNVLSPSDAGLGSHTITYTFIDANGCENSATQNITINNVPTVTFALSDTDGCLSETIHALDGASPVGGGFSGPGVSANNFDASSAGIGTHTITYTYSDVNGCVSTATDYITVENVPSPNLTLAEDESCVTGGSIALSGATPSGGTWSGPGVTGANLDPSAAGVGAHTITYSFTNGSCYTEVTDTFTVYGAPTPTLTLPTTELCIGERINLAGESPTGGSWSGAGVSGSRFISSSAGIGTHTITYTYTDANGCVGTVTDQITVYDLPVVTLNLPLDEDCENNTTLTLSGGSPAEGTFSGNGVTGTNFNASVAGDGVHAITYSFTDTNGCENSAVQNITVNTVPNVTFNLRTDEACIDGANVTLDRARPIGGVWSGPGVTGNQIDPSAAGVGVHTITYSYTINGCTSTVTDQFTVHALPTVILSLPQVEYCLGDIITLTGGMPNGGTYSGPGINSSNGEFNTVVAGLGSHTITYEYTDANGCMASTTQNIQINDVPAANLTLGVNEGCATDTSIPLSGGFPAGGVYSGPGVTGNILDATHPSAGQGVHTVTYTYTDTNGCEAVAIDELTVYSSPDVNFTTQDEYCGQNNGAVSFTFTNNSDIFWIEFSLDGGLTWQSAVRDNTGGVTYSFLSSGSYDLLVRNGNGTCEQSVGTAVINNLGGPTANAGPDATIFPPGSTTLSGSGGNFYQWSPSAGLSNTNIPNPVANPAVTTTYTLEVTDLNGCRDTDEVTVIVVPPCAGTIGTVDGDFPYRESFENGLGLWSQELGADNFDWVRNTGGTPSGSTGPSAASDGNWYVYAEADGNNNEVTILKSPCFDLTDETCAQMNFDYHMNGSAMGSLEIQASIDFGQTWTTIWTESGNHGNTWNNGILELLGFVDQILQLRFIATVGSGNTSDIAIDNVDFITTGCGCDDTSSPFENFNLVPDPQPFSIDIDCDGDADMLAGGDGELFFFENNGNGTYTDQTGTVNDIMPTLTHQDMTLGFCDLDGDGDYDMSIVGQEAFNKRFYWNTGTKTDPVFTPAGSGGTPPNPITVFNFAPLDGGVWIGYADPTIFWADLDGDNDFDAVIGGKLGWFLYYENVGDENNPSFVNRTGSANPFNGLRVDGADEGNGIIQYESAPFLIDWDGDGDLDMFSGNQISTVQYFENIGTATNPQYVERPGATNPFDGVIFSEDSHLSIIDEDCDGDWDVFYGVGDTPDDAEITLCDLLVAVPNNAIPSSDQSNYCAGASAYLDELGTTGVEWEWEGPNGFTSSIQNPTISNLTSADAGAYTVTVTNAQGCEHVNTIEITVSDGTADAGADVCIEQGESTTLNGQGNGISYSWSPSTGLSSSTILNPTATPVVTTTYVLTVTGRFGCQATDEVTIIVKSDVCEEEENIFEADFENTTGDNFWTMNTTATDGDFEIAVPFPYYTAGNLMELTAQSGDRTLLTGNNFGQDLDGGPATARSRNIVISPTATNVDMSFYWYMSHAYNGNSADYLNIEIRDASNGTTLETLVSETGSNYNRPAVWTFHNANLAAHAGRTIYIWVEAADFPGGSKMEVALDDIIITETFETTATFTMSDVDYCEEDPIITLSGGMPAGGVYSGPGVVGNTFDPAIAGPGVHQILYEYTTTMACIATAGTLIEVFEIPLVEVDLTVPEACDIETSVALFGGLPTGGTYSGTGVTGSTMNPSEAGAGTHVITYTVTDVNGCENSSTAEFVVISSPVVTAVNSENASCDLDNGSITIDFDDVSGVTNIEFSLDGGFTWETAITDDLGSVTYSDLLPGSYDVWVRNADADCQVDVDDAIIVDEPSPQVDAGLDQKVCDGTSASTTATVIGGTAPLSYAWTGPNSFTSSSLMIDMANDGIYSITVTDANGCTATDNVYLRYFEVEPGQILEPEILCPSNDPDIIESLEPGISCNRLDNHEFIHDVAGNWFLYQNVAASASFTIDNNSELSGDNSAFIDISSVSGTDWHIMLVQNIGAIYADETYDFVFEAKADAPKTITVQMQEAQAPWTSYGSQTFNIGTTSSTYTWSGISPNIDHNNVKFQFRIGGDDTDIWIDNTVLEPTNCTNSIIEYAWECRESNGLGGWLAWTQIAGATSADYDPPVQTNDKEYRRLANIEGCLDTEASNIVTVELCPCTLMADGTATICPGDSTPLSASGTGVGTLVYAWTPAASLDDASSANPSATPTVTTTYTVTMTDDRGCSVSEDIIVTVTPEVMADVGSDVEICEQESIQLSATGGSYYLWSPATGLSNPNIADPIASPTSTTTYTVTVTDANLCTDTDEVVVTVYQKIENITVSAVDASCGLENGSITITWTTDPSITDIAFSLDGGATYEAVIAASARTVTYSNLPTGNYDIWVRRSDENCLEDISDAVISDQPAPTVDAGADEEICAGDNATLTPAVSGGSTPYTYAWEGPAAYSSSDQNITVSTAGNYIVTVTDANGCAVTDLVVVEILEPEPGQIVEPIMDCPANDPGVITSLELGSVCNIISNHEFDNGTTAWNPFVGGGAGATMSIDNNSVLSGENALYVDITTLTGTDSHIMPFQVIGAIQASETYEFSFEAVAAAPRNVTVMIQEAQAPFTTISSQTFTIGTTPNQYTWSGIAPGVDHNNVRIQFVLGQSDVNIWLDNAVLEETGCTEPVIEYQWECRESDGAGGWNAWTAIPAATSSSYDPPVQTTDKQYRRLASVLGCNTATESIEITVELCPCTIDAGTDAEICSGESTLLDANGTGVGTLSYAWSPSTNLSNDNLANPIASPTTTTTYTVTVSDANGCTATDDVLVTVQDTTEIFCERYRLRYGTNWQPWIPFVDDCVIELCEDSDLNDFQFDGGPNINTGWVWTDEDGNIDPEVDEIVAFGNIGLNDAGIYTGELTNADGCVSRLEFEVIVHPNVTADAGPDQSYCEGADPVMLTASGGSTYLWDDPAGSTTATISVNPTVTTTYTVTVTNGQCSDTDQVTVTVFPTPTADAGADDEFCEGEDVQLNATGGETYEWSPATGLSNANIANPLASPTVTTTYTVTVTDANGCTDTDDIVITVNDLPEVTAITNVDATCGLDNGEITIDFSDVSSISQIEFSLDGGLTWETAINDNSGMVTYDNLASGIYEIWVRDAVTFCAIELQNVTISDIPVMGEAGPDHTICLGESVNITATGGVSYTWDDPLSSTGTPVSVSPTSTTIYTVTITDSNNCTSTDQVVVTVNPLPEPTVVVPEGICVQEGSYTFSATPVPGTEAGDGGVFTTITGLVDNGDGTATLDLSAIGTGTHTIEYTYTDGNGCTASASEDVIVHPDFIADAGVDVEICEGDSIQLQAIGGLSYAWSPAGGLSDPNIADPYAFPTTTTTYTVTVTNDNGCTATDEVTVTVNEALDVSVVALSHDYCQESSGEAIVTITNGVGPFTIEWQSTLGTEYGSDTLSTTGDYTITGLNGGTTYCIQVTDANGCTVTIP